jgi:hypothetical protein
MHYNPNPRLTSESYAHPSVIITIISSGVFLYHSNGTGTSILEIIMCRICVAFWHTQPPTYNTYDVYVSFSGLCSGTNCSTPVEPRLLAYLLPLRFTAQNSALCNPARVWSVVPIVSTSRRIQIACLSVYRFFSRLSIQPSAIPP